MRTFSSSRLAVARSRRRFTRASLAAAVGITPRSITGYEKGEMQPSPEVAEQLAVALRFPIEFLYGPEIERVETLQVSFRALSRLRASDRSAALALADLGVILEGWIDRHFELPSSRVPDLVGGSPEEAAQAIRSQWALADDPIPNLVHLLEAHGVRVFSLAEGVDLDAFSFWSDGAPFIMLNTAKSAERGRLDAAHELAHVVLHRHETSTGSKEVEREAQRFASALLMPEAAIRSMAPRNVDLQSLIELKHYWGVSAVAVAFRLHQLQLMSDWNYRWLFREMSVRGWRSQEPEPMERERSQVIAKVFATLADEGIARGQVAAELAIPIAEVESLSFGLASVYSNRNVPNSLAVVERPSLSLVRPPSVGDDASDDQPRS